MLVGYKQGVEGLVVDSRDRLHRAAAGTEHCNRVADRLAVEERKAAHIQVVQQGEQCILVPSP